MANKRVVKVGIVVAVALFVILFTGAAILRTVIPQEQDFPGLSQEFDKLEESKYFEHINFKGFPINHISVMATAPEKTKVQELRLILCPALLDVATLFIGDRYDMEVTVSTRVESIGGYEYAIIICEQIT